jgi:NTP pyrophosphatase (non-canonical NTP hydrolase)
MNVRENILREIELEIYRAKGMRPNWPTDAVHKAAFVSEEAGELTMAANKYVEGKQHPDLRQVMRTEAIHTAAVAIRFLENL